MVLPYINMNPPQVYMCSPSWTPPPTFIKNFHQLVVIHTVKSFGVVNETEVVVLWNSLAFSMIWRMLAIWSLVLLPFLNSACSSGSSPFMYCWSLTLRILSIALLACGMSAIYGGLNVLWHCPSLGLELRLNFSSPVTTDEFFKFAGILSAAL